MGICFIHVIANFQTGKSSIKVNAYLQYAVTLWDADIVLCAPVLFPSWFLYWIDTTPGGANFLNGSENHLDEFK